LLIPAGVYVYTARQPKTYQANLVVEVDDPGYDAPVFQNLSSNLNPGALLVADSSLPTVVGATTDIGPRPVGTVQGLSATLDTRTGWVTLQASGPSSRVAVAGVNAFLRALTNYVERDARRRLDAAIAATRRGLSATRRQAKPTPPASDVLPALLAQREAPAASLRVVERARASLISPNPGRNALLALALAVLIAPVLALLLDRLDRRVRRSAELESLSGAPLLATIPRQAFDAGDGGSRTELSFQRLRDSLIFLTGERRPDTIAVVSPLDGQGKTTVATRLALSFAHAGRRVLLIDANLGHPGVAARMGLPGSPGLSEVIGGEDVRTALHQIPGLPGELTVLPAGSPPRNPAETLGSPRVSSLLNRVSTEFELVVIDTPSLLGSVSALGLVRQVSGVVAVARLNRTPRGAVRRMAQIAGSANGRLLGVVATGAGESGDAAADAYDRSDADSRRRPVEAH
jgi:Mrp family chromosome partitioning ATPase